MYLMHCQDENSSNLSESLKMEIVVICCGVSSKCVIKREIINKYLAFLPLPDHNPLTKTYCQIVVERK